MQQGRFFVAIWLAVISACTTNTDGASVEILRVVPPDNTCRFTATDTTPTRGFFDPTLESSGFTMALSMRNLMQSSEDNSPEMDEKKIRGRVNDVEVVGFEACYAVQKDSAVHMTERGEVLNCQALKGQSDFLAASGQVEEGGLTQSIILVKVLTLKHLQDLFGPTFEPAKIPIIGAYQAVDFTGTHTNYSFATMDPSSPSRSPFWGTSYPSTRRVEAVVQLRALLQKQNGHTLYSNWFAYPIELCPGCIRAACGDLVTEVCSQPVCSDGSLCVGGQCTIGGVTSACPTASLFSGTVANLSGDGVCYPAQDPAPDCRTKTVGCAATSGG